MIHTIHAWNGSWARNYNKVALGIRSRHWKYIASLAIQICKWNLTVTRVLYSLFDAIQIPVVDINPRLLTVLGMVALHQKLVLALKTALTATHLTQLTLWQLPIRYRSVE